MKNINKIFLAVCTVILLAIPAFANGNHNNGNGGDDHENNGHKHGRKTSGPAGSGTSTSNSTNTNMNSNSAAGGNSSSSASSNQTQGQSQTATGGNATAMGGASTSTSAASNGAQSNSQSTTFTSPRETPSSYAFAAPTSPCRIGNAQGGGSGFFSFSLSQSREDKGCTLRELARSFASIGDVDAARKLLCSTKEARAAKACEVK